MNEPPLDPVPIRETGKLLTLIKFVVDILTISGNKLCFQFFDINQPSWQIFKEELPELNFIPLTWRGLHCFLLSLSTSPIPRPSHPERESLENVINQKTGIIAALNLWDPSNSSSSLLEKLLLWADLNAKAAHYTHTKICISTNIAKNWLNMKTSINEINSLKNKISLNKASRQDGRELAKSLDDELDDIKALLDSYYSTVNNFTSPLLSDVHTVLTCLQSNMSVLELIKPSEMAAKFKANSLHKTIGCAAIQANQIDEINDYANKISELLNWLDQNINQQDISHDIILPTKKKELSSLVIKIKDALLPDSTATHIQIKLLKDDLVEIIASCKKVAESLAISVDHANFGFDLSDLGNLKLKLSEKEADLESDKNMAKVKEQALAAAYARGIAPKEFIQIKNNTWPSFILSLRRERHRYADEVLVAKLKRALLPDDFRMCESYNTAEEIIQFLQKRYGDERAAINKEIITLCNNSRPCKESNREEHSRLTRLYSLLSSLNSNEYQLFSSLKIADLINANSTVETSKAWFSLYYNYKQTRLSEEVSKSSPLFNNENELEVFLEKHERKNHIDKLLCFLNERLEVIRSVFKDDQANPSSTKKGKFGTRTYGKESYKCQLCSSNHGNSRMAVRPYLSACVKFLGMGIKARISACRSYHYCLVCTGLKSAKSHVDNPNACPLVHKFGCKVCDPEKAKNHGRFTCLRSEFQTPKQGKHLGPHHGPDSSGSGQGGPSSHGGPSPKSRRSRDSRSHNNASGSNPHNLPPNTDNAVLTYSKENNLVTDWPLMPVQRCVIDSYNKQDQIVSIPHLSLSDSGSSCTFIDQSLAKDLNLSPKGHWSGSVETMAGIINASYDFFQITFKTVTKNNVDTLALASPHLGCADQIPMTSLAAIRNHFNLPLGLANHGKVQSLIGNLTLYIF